MASKLARLAELWISFGKSLVLHGVIIDGQIIAEEPARTLALGKAWQPTFEATDFDETEALSFLQSVGNIGEYSSDLQGPDYFSFFRATRGRPPTTPGKDTISYAGWLAAGDFGISCMQSVDFFSEDWRPATSW